MVAKVPCRRSATTWPDGIGNRFLAGWWITPATGAAPSRGLPSMRARIRPRKHSRQPDQKMDEILHAIPIPHNARESFRCSTYLPHRQLDGVVAPSGRHILVRPSQPDVGLLLSPSILLGYCLASGVAKDLIAPRLLVLLA